MTARATLTDRIADTLEIFDGDDFQIVANQIRHRIEDATGVTNIDTDEIAEILEECEGDDIEELAVDIIDRFGDRIIDHLD